jgi:hypothetical protein
MKKHFLRVTLAAKLADIKRKKKEKKKHHDHWPSGLGSLFDGLLLAQSLRLPAPPLAWNTLLTLCTQVFSTQTRLRFSYLALSG